MTDKKISELTSITGADVSDANDVLPIVDTSVATTKKITRAELFKGVSSVDINGGTIDGTVIGGSTPAAISGTTGSFSGNVGIGTSSPADKLSLEVGAANQGLSIYYSGVEVGSFRSDSGNATLNANNASLKFATGGSERMHIDSSGNVLCGSDGGGDIGSSTKRFKDLYLSGGVVFGATGGSVTSKTLDDYETGTWTPTFSSSGATFSYGSQAGFYAKVGDVVHAQFYLRATASGTTLNSCKIASLPFASGSINALCQFGGPVWFTGIVDIQPLVDNGASTVTLWKKGVVAVATAAEAATNYFLVGHVSYRTS